MPTNTTWWGQEQPTPDPYASFGGSGGFANLQQPTYTQPGYTPQRPLTGASTPSVASSNGMKEQAMAGSDWIQAAQLIYQAYKDKNPTDPKFAATPLSPEQKQLHQLYLQSLMNPATANNAAYVNDIAKQQLQGLSGMKWTSPKTFSGDVGYSGSNTSFTAPWGPGGITPSPSTPKPYNPYTPENGYNSGNTTVGSSYLGSGSDGQLGEIGPLGPDGLPLAYGDGQQVGDMFSSVKGYLDKHPEMVKSVAKNGLNALGGIFGVPLVGTVATKVYGWLAKHYGWDAPDTQPLPPRRDALADIADKAPGTKRDPKAGSNPSGASKGNNPAIRESWGLEDQPPPPAPKPPDWADIASWDFFGGLGSQVPGENPNMWAGGTGQMIEPSGGGSRMLGSKMNWRPLR